MELAWEIVSTSGVINAWPAKRLNRQLSISQWHTLYSTARSGEMQDGLFDATFDLASETYTYYRYVDGNVWKVTENYSFADGSSSRKYLGESRIRLTGWDETTLSEVRTLDQEGHVVIEKNLVDGPLQVNERTVPVGVNTIESRVISVWGRPYLEVDAQGRTADYQYDELGRQVGLTDFEGVSQSTVYELNSSRVSHVQGGRNQHQVGYAYYGGSAAVGSRHQPEYQYTIAPAHSAYGGGPGSLNPASLVPGDPGVVSVSHFTYDNAGRPDEVYVSGKKQSKTTYDSFGRRATLRVYQSASVSSLVEWNYHSRTGQLLQRKDFGRGFSQIGHGIGGAAMGMLDLAGKTWALPNTAVGLAIGISSLPFGGKVDIGYNAIVFSNVWFQGGNGKFTATTFGNVIVAGSSYERLGQDNATYYSKENGPAAALRDKGFNFTNYGRHEQAHTYQYQILRMLYLPFYLLEAPFTSQNPMEDAADRFGAGEGSWWPSGQ